MSAGHAGARLRSTLPPQRFRSSENGDMDMEGRLVWDTVQHYLCPSKPLIKVSTSLRQLYPLLQITLGLNPTDGTGNTSELDCASSKAANSTLAAAVAVQRISSSFVLQLSTNQTLASEEKVDTPKEASEKEKKKGQTTFKVPMLLLSWSTEADFQAWGKFPVQASEFRVWNKLTIDRCGFRT